MAVTLIVAEIEILEPWIIAVPEVARAIDRPISTDGASRPFVPGSSLAGSLRQHLRSLGAAAMYMGSERPAGAGGGGEGDQLEPSALRILGTSTYVPKPVALRRQTAVDRHSGAAKGRMLRSSQLAPRGTIVTAYLQCEGGRDERLLQAIASWKPFVGGGRTHGLGAGRIRSVLWGELDLEREEGLRLWLTLSGPALHSRVALKEADLPGPTDPLWAIAARFRIVDPVLIGRHPSRTDRPDVEPLSDNGVPVIDGSSLKGVLRSRSEFILRSCGIDACNTSPAGCGTCPACDLFGHPEQAAAVRIQGSSIQEAELESRTHVAIDRVTGGSAESLLFEEEVVVAGYFDLVIEAVEGRELPLWTRGLLLHVLADLNDGMIGIGSRTTRGYGTVRLEDPTVLDDEDAGTAFREFVTASAL